MLQPVDSATCIPPTILAGETHLPVTDKFCYLGSILSCDTNVDADINSRVAKASQSFCRLSRRLWDDHGIRCCDCVVI